MAFIRHVKRGNNTYAYLVESYRKNGKVKQRTLEYLGKVTGEDDDSIIIPPKHKRAIKTIKKRGIELLAPLFSDRLQMIMGSMMQTCLPHHCVN